MRVDICKKKEEDGVPLGPFSGTFINPLYDLKWVDLFLGDIIPMARGGGKHEKEEDTDASLVFSIEPNQLLISSRLEGYRFTGVAIPRARGEIKNETKNQILNRMANNFYTI